MSERDPATLAFSTYRLSAPWRRPHLLRNPQLRPIETFRSASYLPAYTEHRVWLPAHVIPPTRNPSLKRALACNIVRPNDEIVAEIQLLKVAHEVQVERGYPPLHFGGFFLAPSDGRNDEFFVCISCAVQYAAQRVRLVIH